MVLEPLIIKGFFTLAGEYYQILTITFHSFHFT
jgi:hypothetical protein